MLFKGRKALLERIKELEDEYAETRNEFNKALSLNTALKQEVAKLKREKQFILDKAKKEEALGIMIVRMLEAAKQYFRDTDIQRFHNIVNEIYMQNISACAPAWYMSARSK